ncbi:MAG: hypothetical protein KDA33_03795 [Phycisphaerales bacterium]|nr:hypothetical protein [Phycisphaerales bacterium]
MPVRDHPPTPKQRRQHPPLSRRHPHFCRPQRGEQLDERHARIVGLRVFGAVTIDQTARVLEDSDSTIESEWRKILARLVRELKSA